MVSEIIDRSPSNTVEKKWDGESAPLQLTFASMLPVGNFTMACRLRRPKEEKKVAAKNGALEREHLL
jgi:hypothetical protein